MPQNLIAHALANADATQQADTFNQFVLMLTSMCKANPLGAVDSQQYYIAKELRGETVSFFKGLLESWEYLNKESDKARIEINALAKRRDELQRQVDELEKQLSE